MKYGYYAYDQNLFDVIELHEVKNLERDLELRGYLFAKDKWMVAKTYANAISPFPVLKRSDDLGYWVLIPREHVFDSREAAIEFGKTKEDWNCYE